MTVDDWQQQKHDEVFEQTCVQLEMRRRIDPSFALANLTAILEGLYVRQGNDATSQGGPGGIVQSATIAAHEHILAEWRKEQTPEQ